MGESARWAPGTSRTRLFSPLQGVELLQTAALLGVLLLGFGYFWLLVPDLEARLQQLGLFCSVFTISMYLSPLTDLVSGSGSVPGGGGDKKGPRARDCSFPSRGERKIPGLEGDRAIEVGEWEARGEGWVAEGRGGCLPCFLGK